MPMISRPLLKPIGLGLLMLCSSAWTGPINLGVAENYSGFFFGDVSAAADVEGRLALGGNLSNGFDIGYRNPANSLLPSLVVGGDINISHGTIYNGPQYDVDTNASIGPAAAGWLAQHQVNYGTVYYGGSANTHSWSNGDYQHIKGNLPSGQTSVAVPDSATFGLVAFGLALLLWRARPRQRIPSQLALA